MNCNECIHSEKCNIKHWNEESQCVENLCNFFYDRNCIIELPCDVGDKVWYIADKDTNNTEVLGIIPKSGKEILCKRFEYSDIGKPVFLSPEAAEEALKKDGGNK